MSNDSLLLNRSIVVTGPRLSAAALARLPDLLSTRDRAILSSLGTVRVASGSQAERLHFYDLPPATRSRTRRRVLGRLVRLGVVATLERQIGGVRAGSAGLLYTLGIAGQRLLPVLGLADHLGSPARARRPWTPGMQFLAHTLDVSELYVRLVEEQRAGHVELQHFRTEPACWRPLGSGGVLKPDAYLVLRGETADDFWWIEVDRATESLPTLRRKLLAYVDFANAGALGPDGVMPRVLLTAPHQLRLDALAALVDGLPHPARQLIHPVPYTEAILHLIGLLRE